jgi:hypothetical protein
VYGCLFAAEACGCWARKGGGAGDDSDSDEEDEASAAAAKSLVDDCLGQIRGGGSDGWSEDDDWSDAGWTDDDDG